MKKKKKEKKSLAYLEPKRKKNIMDSWLSSRPNSFSFLFFFLFNYAISLIPANKCCKVNFLICNFSTYCHGSVFAHACVYSYLKCQPRPQ